MYIFTRIHTYSDVTTDKYTYLHIYVHMSHAYVLYVHKMHTSACMCKYVRIYIGISIYLHIRIYMYTHINVFRVLFFTYARCTPPLMEVIRLKTFGLSDCTVFLYIQLSYGASYLLPWILILKIGDSREDLFESYGDSRENFFEFLAVV